MAKKPHISPKLITFYPLSQATSRTYTMENGLDSAQTSFTMISLSGGAGPPASTSPRLTWEELKKYPRLIPGRFEHIFKISETAVVKCGVGTDRISEANTMRYIRENTTIPIPEVYDVYVNPSDKKIGMLHMSLIEGDILADVWETMDSASKESVITDLRGYVSQLRQLKGTYIGKVDGTGCEDPMFDNFDMISYGPYKNEAEFNNAIVDWIMGRPWKVHCEMISDMVHCLKNHEIVMTHADLVSRNIIVKDAKIAAILDWEQSGFFPEYWEYQKALFKPNYEHSWIKERVTDQIMDPYHLEYAILLHVHGLWW